MKFEEIFRTNNLEKDKYLSRLFGIFNEKIAEIYFKSEFSEYKNLGRPTLYKKDEKKGSTLDFTLECKKDKKMFIAEMKCELQYENYKYLCLRDDDQLRHHIGKKAFEKFLEYSLKPDKYEVKMNGRKIEPKPCGSILIWGSIELDKIDAIKKKRMFHDILSLEIMISKIKDNKDYENFINDLKLWSYDLFNKII